jgi:hypothetical protein
MTALDRSHEPHSRRRIMTAGIGAAIAAFAGGLAKAAPATAHDNDDVQRGVDNSSSTHRTLISNAHASVANPAQDEFVDAIFGLSNNNGAAVAGQSTGGGVGVKGYSGPIPMPNTLGSATGVYGKGPAAGVTGESDSGVGVSGQGKTEGVFGLVATGGFGVRGFGGIGVLGVSNAGDEPDDYPPSTGVFGYSDNASPNVPTPVGVQGWSPNGIGVYARATGTATALKADGKVHFSRSGKASIAANTASIRVTLAGVTASSLIFAVLAKNVAGRYVRAVVPANGSFTIYLNRSIAASAPVSWFVLD